MDKDSKKEIMFDRMREKKKEVKVVRKIVLGITLILLLIGLIGGRSVYKYITGALQPVDPDSEEVIEVEIPIGSGLDMISAELAEKGIIKDARVFKYYAKFNNESQFQAGTYGLTKAMTLDELIESLENGESVSDTCLHNDRSRRFDVETDCENCRKAYRYLREGIFGLCRQTKRRLIG